MIRWAWERVTGTDANGRYVREPDHDKAREEFKLATVDAAGVVRWRSNGRVAPADCVLQFEEAGCPGVSVSASEAAREAELQSLFSQTRATGFRLSLEDALEARAAFGPGAELVNVLTGRRVRT